MGKLTFVLYALLSAIFGWYTHSIGSGVLLFLLIIVIHGSIKLAWNYGET